MTTGGTDTGRPPPSVVAAAALAGLQALFCLVPGLSGLSLGLGGSVGALLVGLGYLALSAGAVFGAVHAVRGRTAQALVTVGVVLAAVWALNTVLSLVTGLGLDVLSVLLLVLAVVMVVLLRRPDVQQWAGSRTR